MPRLPTGVSRSTWVDSLGTSARTPGRGALFCACRLASASTARIVRYGLEPCRTAAHLLWLALHLVRGWAELVVVFPLLSEARRGARVQAWCARFLRIARVTVIRSGKFQGEAAALLVSNHVSWLDVVVIRSLRPTRFVAKSEIRAWPVIGAIATRCGTLFVDRQRKAGTLGVAQSIAAALGAAQSVALFPEGTTTDGTSVLPFHPGLLQGAISAGVAVQPIALKFTDSATGCACRRTAYCGQDTLLGSAWRTLGRPVTVRAAFGTAVPGGGTNRRGLAARLHGDVQQLLADAPGGAGTVSL